MDPHPPAKKEIAAVELHSPYPWAVPILVQIRHCHLFRITGMTSQRVWTTDSIQAWRKERDDVRTKEGLPAMAALTVDAKADALKLEKKTLVEAEFSILTSNAWPLDKYPNNAYPAPFSGYLLLPRGYRTNQKNDKVCKPLILTSLSCLTIGNIAMKDSVLRWRRPQFSYLRALYSDYVRGPKNDPRA